MSNNNVCAHTARIKLPYILQAQAQKEVTHNQALNILDVLVNTVAESITDIPPEKASEGDIYIVGKNSQGIFEGNENNLAQFIENSWTFYQPINYMEVMVVDKKQKFSFIDKEWISVSEDRSNVDSADRANSDNTANEFLKIESWQEDLALSGKVTASKTLYRIIL